MEQALEDSGISIAPLERPRASNTHHMPPPPSILGARTHRAERIAKEAENAPSSEKSSSTESSSTESSSDEVENETNSKSSAKSSDINSSRADNGNTENVSDIEDQSVGNKASDVEDQSVGNKASDVEDGSDADKITDAGKIKASDVGDGSDTDKITDAGKMITDAGKIADAEHTKAGEAPDNKQSHTAGFSMDTKDAVSTENSKALDSQSQNLDNTSKTQQSLPVQDDESLVLSTPLKRPVPNNSDIDMDSPPDLQGASRMTGGIFRGKAYGNVINHADFPDLAADAVPTMGSKLSFKILAHVEYGDAFSVNLAPDFVVQLPISVFFLTGTSLLAQLILKKMAQLHDKITSKIYYTYKVIY